MTIEKFDKAAEEWEKPHRVERARRIARAMTQALDLRGTEVCADLGSGTGLIARELYPSVSRIVAIDTSAGMLEELSRRAQHAGMTGLETRQLDLQNESPGTELFDVVVSSMALHHMKDTALVLSRIYESLRPGGKIAIADLDAEDGSFHDSNDGVAHFGFDREILRQQLEQSGFKHVLFATVEEMEKNYRHYSVFLVTAAS